MTVRMISPMHPLNIMGFDPVPPTAVGVQVVVPNAQVSGTLNDFPLVITERDMPTNIWDDGAINTFQAYDEDGTALDTEVAWFDSANQRLRVHVKVPTLSAVSDTVVNLFWADTPTATSAVFTMYDIVVPLKVLAQGQVANYGTESVTLQFAGTITYTNLGALFGSGNAGISAAMTAKPDFYGSIHGRQSDADQKSMLAIYSTTTDATTITIDDGIQAARFDSVNSWLDTSPVQDPGVGNFFSMAMRVDNATEHNVWFNGGFKGTDGAPSATSSHDNFVIGIAANDTLDWMGELTEARISTDITFSESWVQFEHRNYDNTSEYTVASLTENPGDVPPYLVNVSFLQDTEGELPGSQNITDASLNNNTVTVVGNTNIQADGSVYFDGDGDYYQIPHSAAVSVANSNDMVLEVELNWDGDGDSTQSILNKRDGGSAEEFRMTINGGNYEFITFISGSADVNLVGPAVTSGVWHNFRMERVSGTWTMYVDDVEQVSATESNTPSSNGAPLNIGHSAFNGTRQYKGFLRKAKIVQVP